MLPVELVVKGLMLGEVETYVFLRSGEVLKICSSIVDEQGARSLALKKIINNPIVRVFLASP